MKDKDREEEVDTTKPHEQGKKIKDKRNGKIPLFFASTADRRAYLEHNYYG